MRPQSEWISHADELLRIIPEAVWRRAKRRMDPAKDDVRLKSGGRPKYLLSGLLRCSECGSNFTILDSRAYGCLSNVHGTCSNAVRITKTQIEEVLLRGPDTGLSALLAPERVQRMATEMQAYYVQRVKAIQTRATEAPRELQELAARIERLKERLVTGDPDMPADELQAAIDRAEQKRTELHSQQPEAKQSAKGAVSIAARRRSLPPADHPGPRRQSP